MTENISTFATVMFARQRPFLEFRVTQMTRAHVEIGHPTRHGSFVRIDFLPRGARRRFDTIRIALRRSVHARRGVVIRIRRIVVVVRVVELDQGVNEALHSSHVFVQRFDLLHVGAFFLHHAGRNRIGNFRQTVDIDSFSYGFDRFVRCR